MAFYMALCLAALPLAAADTFGNFTYTDDGATITITGYPQQATGPVVIPSVIAGKAVTAIGDIAFWRCSSLTSVTIPNSVKSIGYQAFDGCTALTNMTIPYSVTSIGTYAFIGCSSLTSMEIPNSLTAIAHGTFQSCTGLSNVTIPSTITRIGDGAFSGCSGLSSVIIPPSVASIGDFAFSGAGLSTVTINRGVTSIGAYAFSGCNSLIGIFVPDTVTSIGDSAFAGCDVMTAILVDPRNLNYSSLNAVIFNKEQTTLVAYPSGNQGSYRIPSGVASIGNGAFSGCSVLTSLTIPNSVTSIGENAFFECSGLTSVIIPSSVTSIGEYAFFECSGLISISIPNSVTSIEDSTFEGCSRLTKLTIPIHISRIGYSAFYGCNGLTSVTIPSSVTSIDDDAFSGCGSLTSADFLGYAPKMGRAVFDDLPGFVIRYFKGKSGFTTPYWNGYRSEAVGRIPGGDNLLKVLMPTMIPVGGAGPLCIVYCKAKDQTMAYEAYYTKSGIPKGPKSLAFLDMKNPLKSFKINFDGVGAPTSFVFANGSKITLQELNGGRKVQMKIYNRSGKLVMSKGNILPAKNSSLRFPAGSLMGMVQKSRFVSPFRIRWEDVGDFNREDLVSNFGSESGNSLGNFLDHSTDLVNKLVDRVSDIAIAGPSAGAKVAVVAEGFISDGLGILAERTKSKSVEIIQMSYDVSGDLKNIGEFFQKPSINGIVKLVNGIESTVELVSNRPVDLKVDVKSDPPEDGNHLQNIKSDLTRFGDVLGLMGQPYNNNGGTLSRNDGYFTAGARCSSLIDSIRDELNLISTTSTDYGSGKAKLASARSRLSAKLGSDLTYLGNKLSELRQSRPSIRASLASLISLLQATTDPAKIAIIQGAVQDIEASLVILDQHEAVMVDVQADVKAELERIR